MMQKTFDRYGDELTGAASALVDFEKTHKREIGDLVDQHDALQRKVEHLETKAANEKADMDKRLSNFHRELAERETKTRADLRAELGRKSLTEQGRKLEMSDDAIEEAVLAALEKSARAVLQLRGRFIDCLKLERDLAELRGQAASLAMKPLQMREAAARNFLDSLLATAGVSIPGKMTVGHSSDEVTRMEKAAKSLDEKIAIISGAWGKNFQPLHFRAASADQILEFALSLPEATFPQIFRAWQVVKLQGGKNASLHYDGRVKKLTWRFRRSRVVDQPRIRQTSDYGAGSSSPDRPSRRARA